LEKRFKSPFKSQKDSKNRIFKRTQKYENLNPNVWKFDLKKVFLTISALLDSWSRDVDKLAKTD
jgi:hypothetical protein